MGEYSKALPLCEQARDLFKQLVEAHPNYYAACLNDLALLYRALGEYGKALPLLEQVRDLYKRVLGEAHPRYAASLNNLAALYQDLGEYGKALPLFEQARNLRKRLLETPPAYAISRHHLGLLCKPAGG